MRKFSPAPFGTRKLYWCILLAIPFLAFSLWTITEGFVSNLERQVRQNEETPALQSRESILKTIAEHRITPDSLKRRAHGLLGDLYCQQYRWDNALEQYKNSIPSTFDQEKKHDVSALVKARLAAMDTDFAKGFTAYTTDGSPFDFSPLDDSDLTQSPLPLPDSKNARSDFEKITPLDGDEMKELSHMFLAAQKTPRITLIRDFCETNKERIAAICALGEHCQFSNENPQDLMSLYGFIKLVAIDAFSKMHRDGTTGAEESFDAAYRLIGYFPQNPQLLTCQLDNHLRNAMAEILHNDFGRPSRRFFKAHHRLDPDSFEAFVRGEYQVAKSKFPAPAEGSTPENQRVRDLLLTRNLEYFRRVLEGGDTSRERFAVQSLVPSWYFSNRQYFYAQDTATFAEGQSAARELEEMTVKMVESFNTSNFSDVKNSFAAAIEAESILLAGHEVSSIEESYSPGRENTAR